MIYYIAVIHRASLAEIGIYAKLQSSLNSYKRLFSTKIKSDQRTGLLVNAFNSKFLRGNSIRPKSWWTRHRVFSLPKSLRNKLEDGGICDANNPFKYDARAKASLRKTKQKLKETQVLVTKKMEDMKENILTVPNALCVGRIATTPILGYLVIQESFVPAFCIFVFAGMTDLLDGYVARNYANQKSKFGSFLDPAADKFLVSTLVLTLTFAALIPVPLTALIVTRDIGLFGAGCYIRYLSLPQPKTLSRYFDATLATASVSPTFISKTNTAVQLCLVGASLAAPVFGYVGHEYLEMLWYVTATTTILSGLSYLFTKNTYKIFKNKL